ncbi:MAG: hypothetical protein ACD_24C00305G0001 [uncultured bacterium]|uniref:Uncharacterized protein n=1 Tax=candidate division WWE3 bacterium RBG_16_37_10 TaxID=1802610 RepID=A0A1F4V2X0_UNCKA|nr:MAG: hypothetical protein ACD_24C00305G0001 [uncultured bacterium]OGC51518.1 MAG: hypothetical protein A2W32_04535 [candidate division WWE3 bacterium RBG_16_37_10]
MIKKLPYILIVLILVILDFAALDDITTGNEPNYTLEFVILALSVFAYTFLVIKFLLNHKISKIR